MNAATHWKCEDVLRRPVTIEGRWRLHLPRPYRIEKFGAESQLYDIAVDPLERQPVQDPELIRELEGTIAAWLDYYEALEDGRVVTDDFDGAPLQAMLEAYS